MCGSAIAAAAGVLIALLAISAGAQTELTLWYYGAGKAEERRIMAPRDPQALSPEGQIGELQDGGPRSDAKAGDAILATRGGFCWQVAPQELCRANGTLDPTTRQPRS